MMQISLTLDPTVFSDIQAPDGTKAKNGKDTSLTFTAMPGEDEEFIVSAEVTDFEMNPIEISATPASMRSEEHTSELQSRFDLVCRLLLEKKKYKNTD